MEDEDPVRRCVFVAALDRVIIVKRVSAFTVGTQNHRQGGARTKHLHARMHGYVFGVIFLNLLLMSFKAGPEELGCLWRCIILVRSILLTVLE